MWTTLRTPAGMFTLEASDTALTRVHFGLVSLGTSAGSCPILEQACAEIREYWEGRRRSFNVPLDWGECSPFRHHVYRHLSSVPFGETLTYAELARRAGSPGAARAVGTACATNPLPLVVPCHRVVPASGGIGNYAGGREMKEILLRLEGAVDAPATPGR